MKFLVKTSIHKVKTNEKSFPTMDTSQDEVPETFKKVLKLREKKLGFPLRATPRARDFLDEIWVDAHQIDGLGSLDLSLDV